MKKNTVLVISLGIVTSFLGIQHQQVQAAEPNLLSNPGCELGTSYYSPYQATLSTSSSIKHSGNYSCVVSAKRGKFYTIQSTESYTNPQVGDSFTGTAWVRSDKNNGDRVFLALRESGGSQSSRTLYGDPVILTNQWQLVTTTITVQASGRTSLDFYVVQDPSSKRDRFYVDDLTFQKNSVATPTPSPTIQITPTENPNPTPTVSVTPSVSPTPTPSTSPSGETMPVGDLIGWKQIFAEDFTVDAPIGSWGASCDDPGGWQAAGQKIVYTGENGTQWRTYPDCYTDTYQHRPYRSDEVLSVAEGVLNFYLHPVDGQPAGANPSPLIDGLTQYQTYGRYAARFKVDNANLSDYYAAWLLWPQSENWGVNGDGEEDFPEGRLSSTIGGFHHCLYNTAINCASANTNEVFTQWHTYVMEWTPFAVKFILDGQVILNYTNTSEIPNTPMRWQLQTETNVSKPNLNAGNLEVDWVTVYSYDPMN